MHTTQYESNPSFYGWAITLENGMKYEGTLRDGQKNVDGTFVDLNLYKILQQDRR